MGCLTNILKFEFLFLLSFIYSFSFINHIPILISYLNNNFDINFINYILIVIFLVIYDITKYIFNFFISLLIKLLKDINEIISISICFLTLIHLFFAFIFYYNNNLYIFILYRIFLSLFNNSNSYISSPITILFKNKKIPYKLQIYAILQRCTNFLIFPLSLIFIQNNLSIFSFIISLICFICFLLYVIVFICPNNKKYIINYSPQLSERECNKFHKPKNDLIYEQNIESKNISITSGKNFKFMKKNFNNNSPIYNNSGSLNNEGDIAGNNNINQVEYKSENYGDNTNLVIINNENNVKNYLYINNNKNIDNNTDNNGLSNEIFKHFNGIENENKNINENYKANTVKFKQNNNQEILVNKEASNALEIVSNPNNSKFEISNKIGQHNIIQTSSLSGHNHSNTVGQSNLNNIKNLISTKKTLDNIKNEKLSKIKYKNIISIIYSIIKFINNFSLFMLVLKYYLIKNYLEENKLKGINSSFIEVILLFSCFYLINIFLLPFNKMMTSLAIKKINLIKKISFYPALVIFFISSIIFTYLFLNKCFNERYDIILSFLFEVIMCECSMIISVYYSAFVTLKGINQQLIKKIKSLGNFYGGFSFIIINIIRGIFIYILNNRLFDKFFFYSIFSIFIIIVLIFGYIYV